MVLSTYMDQHKSTPNSNDGFKSIDDNLIGIPTQTGKRVYYVFIRDF